MAAQRVQAFLRDDGDENGPEIGPQTEENDLGRDGDRWATVERRLDQADSALVQGDQIHDVELGRGASRAASPDPHWASIIDDLGITL